MTAQSIKTKRTSASGGIRKEVISSQSCNTEVSRGLNTLADYRYLASTKLINQVVKFFFFLTDEVFLKNNSKKLSFLQWDWKAFDPCICHLFKLRTPIHLRSDKGGFLLLLFAFILSTIFSAFSQQRRSDVLHSCLSHSWNIQKHPGKSA